MTQRTLGQALQAMATVQRLKGLLTVAIVAPSLMFLLLGWYEYERSARAALNSLDQKSRIVHEHAVKVLENNEVILERFLDLLGDRSSEALSRDEQQLHSALSRLASRFDQIRSLTLWNEEGRPILSSRIYPLQQNVTVADRPFFRGHKEKNVRFSINEPVEGRLDGERIFSISHVRKHADGRFAGVVSASFSPQYFSAFYRRAVGEEAEQAIALLRADGEVVARYPASATSMKLPQSSPLLVAVREGILQGVIRGMEGVDEQIRFVAFRKVASHPLYIAVSRTRASVYAEWWHDVRVVALFLLPGILVLIFALWLTMQKARSEHDAVIHFHGEETKRREAENRLRQLQKFEALGQLTSGLAHDFNNLLHIVSTNTTVISLMPPGMDQSRQLAAVKHALSTGQALVAHLLAFARKKTLALEAVNPSSILPDMCALAKHSLPNTIHMQCVVEPDVWDVKVDRAELELAIINMTVNSRDAMPDGGTITILARNIPKGHAELIEAHLPRDDYVALSVCDEGSGIPTEIVHQVFQPFFTTKQESNGSGLGLSRVYGYAHQLGGAAIARNGAESGAVITLYIPRFDASADSDSSPGAEIAGAAQPTAANLKSDERHSQPGYRLASAKPMVRM